MSDLETDAMPSLNSDQISHGAPPDRPEPDGACDDSYRTGSPKSSRKSHWLPSMESSVDPPNSISSRAVDNKSISSSVGIEATPENNPASERSQGMRERSEDITSLERTRGIITTPSQTEDNATPGYQILEKSLETMSSQEASNEITNLLDQSDIEIDATPEDETQESRHGCASRADSGLQSTTAVPQNTTTGTPTDSVKTNYDVGILCHYRCHEQANKLQKRLQNLSFTSCKQLNVILSEEFAKAGATEIANLDDLILNVPCIFLMIEDKFFTDPQCLFAANVSMSFSLIDMLDKHVKENFVIPVFMKNKREIKGITPSIQAMTGINYHQEEWNDRTQIAFKKNVQRCLDKAKQMENEKQIAEDFNQLRVST